MKRIFAAVDIPDETRRRVAEYVARLRAEFPALRVGWEKPEKLHLTLKFFGDADEARLKNLTEAVGAAAKQISGFNLRISKTGAFPSRRNARILWLGVEDETGSLRALSEILEAECERHGFARERRSFKPHLTIARLREPQKLRELIEKHLRNDFESEIFEVSAATIYESRLDANGSLYSVVEKTPFGEARNC